MNYTYKFEKIDPKNLFVQVRYMCEGRPDQLKNFVAGSMEKEAIQEMVEVYASQVIRNWENIEAAPEEVDFIGEVHEASYEEWGLTPTIIEDFPSYDLWTQKVEEHVSESRKEVRVSYSVVNLTSEEEQSVLEEGAAALRRDRDLRLAETDFMMFSDTPNPSQEWLDYRQALRDVPQQAGFPKNIVWPEKPL